MNSSKSEVIVHQNPYNYTWEIGWWSEEYGFTPEYCGYQTKKEAEAQIPGFEERVKKDMDDLLAERAAEERWQNEQWPNIGHVRAQIQKLFDRKTAKSFVVAFDAQDKLDALLSRDLAPYISWPLPSWKAINSGRVYGR